MYGFNYKNIEICIMPMKNNDFERKSGAAEGREKQRKAAQIPKVTILLNTSRNFYQKSIKKNLGC